MSEIIHESGEWTLAWNGADLEARKSIPYDGVLRYTTEKREHVSARKNSEYNLSEREVVAWYARITQPEENVDELLDAAEAAAGVSADA